MASLPIEIITEILVHLPIKSLLRFLCVSKSWNSLIKNPNFIKLHLNKTLISNSDTYIILSYYRSIYIAEFNLDHVHSPLSFSELRDPFGYDEVYVIGSCNGILCISDITRKNVFLYNPLTKSHRKIPVKRIKDLKWRHNDRLHYGFGYDSSTDDYKLFSFFQKLNLWEVEFTEIEVFSCRSNSWKPIEVIFGFDFFFAGSNFLFNGDGVYLNEALYFVVDIEHDNLLHHRFVAKFDYRTDALLRILFPIFDDRTCHILELSALDGCLCMLISYFLRGTGYGSLVRADLWMMKDPGENEFWVRLFSIRDPQDIGIDGKISRKISAVARSKDGSRILLSRNGSKLGWYDLGNRSFETVTVYGHPEQWMNSESEVRYISGNLVSLVNDRLQLER